MKKWVASITAVLAFSCTPGWLSMMTSVQDDFKEGELLYRNDNYAGAVQKLTRGIDNIPVAEKMYLDSSGTLTAESRPRWEGLKSDGLLYVRSIRGHSYLNLKQYDQAKNDANWVITTYNKNKCVREEDKKICETAVETAVFVRGQIYHEASDYKRAIRDYDWIVRNGKVFLSEAHENRGRACLGTGDFKEAYESFSELLKRSPSHAQAYALRC